jgi:outer membrane protein TolC
VPAGLPSELIERHPDLRQAEQQLIAANAQNSAAWAEHFPVISLNGLFGAGLFKAQSGPGLRRELDDADLHGRRHRRHRAEL